MINADSWDNDVEVTHVRYDEPSRALYCLVRWKDGKTYKVSSDVCREKCPKQVSEFFFFFAMLEYLSLQADV